MSKSKIDIQRENDKEFREKLIAEKTLEMKKKLRENTAEKAVVNSRGPGHLDANGNMVPARDPWEDVIESAKGLLESSMNTFEEWSTGELKIMNSSRLLHIALSSSFQPKVEMVLMLVWDKTLGKMVTPLLEKAGLKQKVAPPDVTVDININEHSQLSVTGLKDGQPFDAHDDKLFKVGVVAWLMKNGYELDPRTGQVSNENGLITHEQFKTLGQDPVKGYQSFLNYYFGMAIDFDNTPEQPSLSP